MSTVAREYAEALFLLACEENAEKEIGESLSAICRIFDGSPEYKDLPRQRRDLPSMRQCATRDIASVRNLPNDSSHGCD